MDNDIMWDIVTDSKKIINHYRAYFKPKVTNCSFITH